MFLIDIENFDTRTRSILPCSSLPRNLGQSEVCWNLSKIPLPVFEAINYFLFDDYCFAPKAQVVWFEIFYFIKIILFAYFVLNIFFSFCEDHPWWPRHMFVARVKPLVPLGPIYKYKVV